MGFGDFDFSSFNAPSAPPAAEVSEPEVFTPPPPPPPVVFEPPPPAIASTSEFDLEIFSIVAPPSPPPVPQLEDPALAGLEEFLAAIMRARSGGATGHATDR